MFYPLKFKPVYKDYIWGGRNLETFGKELPEGIVAESWEISCHPNGISVIANGEFAGTPLTDYIAKFGRQAVGTALPEKDLIKFPLLVKLIDANQKLSVQVHPDDAYAQIHEHGELGKNEMWHILAAQPGAKLVYDVVPGVTRESFAAAVREQRIENCLKSIEVAAGDTVNIPAGLVHAIGEGIVLAEIQQNSDTTYRVYDYERVDKNGNKRPLHIEKALEVIDFNAAGRSDKIAGLTIALGPDAVKRHLVANRYFSVELYTIHGEVAENAAGSKFFLYIITEGAGEIRCGNRITPLQRGESVLIPASLGEYTLQGGFKALKAYVPDLEREVIGPLRRAGYGETEIYAKVSGLR